MTNLLNVLREAGWLGNWLRDYQRYAQKYEACKQKAVELRRQNKGDEADIYEHAAYSLKLAMADVADQIGHNVVMTLLTELETERIEREEREDKPHA